MKISVVIPVFNSERFIEATIASALAQPQVVQVILVDDGSEDDSLAICRSCALRDARITVLTHEDGENRGVSATRNLGIMHVQSEFIAFLDSDDMYADNAFSYAQNVFARHKDADGVYGHIGTKYHDLSMREKHLERTGSEISGIKTQVSPQNLAATILRGNFGHISLDSMVLRRKILTEDFMFDESMTHSEDVDFLLRLAIRYRLYSGGKEALVAFRGVHEHNSVFNVADRNRGALQYLSKTVYSGFHGYRGRTDKYKMLQRYVSHWKLTKRAMRLPLVPAAIMRRIIIFLFLLSRPRILIAYLR